MARRATIISMGGYHPGEPIPTTRIRDLVGDLPESVEAGLGIETRYWAIDPETGEHRENNSDLAVKAAARALDLAGITAGDLDFMFLATGTPEYVLPPTVNVVQEKLGLERCATLELRSGGAGWVQALDLARMYIEQETYDRGLVIGSEMISPVLAPVYLRRGSSASRVRDRMPVYMFGDGAGAAVVGAHEGEGGLLGGAMRAIGGARKAGIHAIGGGTHAPMHEQHGRDRLVELRVDVVGAAEFTPQMVVDSLSGTLSALGIEPRSVEHCLIPEGNARWMTESLEAAGLETPEWVELRPRVFDSLATIGACGCAAVPLFGAQAWQDGRLQVGDRVMLIGVEATKWIWAGEVIDWTAPTPARAAVAA